MADSPSSLPALRASFEDYLQSALPSASVVDNGLLEAVRYSCCEHGGKRLRPLLVLSTCIGLSDSEVAAYPAAAAVELIHCYSLIHDDLPALDNDDTRRGAASCHKRFGEATAILAGDLLQPLALRLLCERAQADKRLALLGCLLRASEAMVYGQQLDMTLTPSSGTLEQVRTMHLQKSATLIACCLEMGAICADVEPSPDLPALRQIGLDLGLAFQIQDDVLDFESEEDKCTWPSFVGVAAARAEAQDLYQSCQQRLAELSWRGNSAVLSELLTIMQNRGS